MIYDGYFINMNLLSENNLSEGGADVHFYLNPVSPNEIADTSVNVL